MYWISCVWLFGVFFSSIQNVLPLKQEVALHTCKLQGECQAVTVMRAAPGQCHPHRTSDERGPIGPQLGSKCLKSELQMMSLLFLHSLCSPWPSSTFQCNQNWKTRLCTLPHNLRHSNSVHLNYIHEITPYLRVGNHFHGNLSTFNKLARHPEGLWDSPCAYTYTKFCPVSTPPCTVKNRHIHWRRYKIQETLYLEQWHLSLLQSRHLGTSHSSLGISSTLQNPLLEPPSAASLYFLNLIEVLKSLPFQR